MQGANWYEVYGETAVCQSCGWQHDVYSLKVGEKCRFCANQLGIPNQEVARAASSPMLRRQRFHVVSRVKL